MIYRWLKEKPIRKNEAIGHGYRWIIGGFYSRFKRSFGEYVLSGKRKNVEKELVTMANLLNCSSHRKYNRPQIRITMMCVLLYAFTGHSRNRG